MIWEQGSASMRYEKYGSGPKTLLLLHGWGCSLDVFSPVIRDFEKTMTVYAVDFPGHGRSPEPPEAWSVTEYAHLLIDMLDGLKIGPCSVLAHSFGGRVALITASERPDLVEKMVITGGAGIPDRDNGKVSARTKLYRFLRGLTRALPKKAGDAAREALIRKFGSADYKALTPSMRETFKKVIRQDLTYTLASVKAPTLLFWGTEDTATPLWMGEMMEKTIPDAALIREEGATHFAFLERYGRFRAVLASFLEVEL